MSWRYDAKTASLGSSQTEWQVQSPHGRETRGAEAKKAGGAQGWVTPEVSVEASPADHTVTLGRDSALGWG